MGRRTTAELVRAREVGRVLATDLDERGVRELADLFGGVKGKVELVAMAEGAEAAAFARADVVVSCAGPQGDQEVRFVAAALEAGVPYVSLCDDTAATRAALALADGARPNGPTIVLGCGLRPGLTNLLFRFASQDMDSVEAASIAVATSVSSDTGPSSELHDLRALGSEIAVLSEGRMEVSPAGSSPQRVYFPEPVGWVETFRCAHPEVFTLSKSTPAIRDLQWRFGLVEKAAMDALRASARFGFAKSGARRRGWLKLSGALRPLFERVSTGGGWSAARVDVWGVSGGRPSEVSIGVVDHLTNLTTVPLVWAAVGLGAKAIHKPGVWAPEAVIDAHAAVTYMSRRGIRVARLEPDAI
jgi:saccharopine dehydrogenase-like NADP-dependent oxidoreductase